MILLMIEILHVSGHQTPINYASLVWDTAIIPIRSLSDKTLYPVSRTRLKRPDQGTAVSNHRPQEGKRIDPEGNWVATCGGYRP